jgi:hypothetical protein
LQFDPAVVAGYLDRTEGGGFWQRLSLVHGLDRAAESAKNVNAIRPPWSAPPSSAGSLTARRMAALMHYSVRTCRSPATPRRCRSPTRTLARAQSNGRRLQLPARTLPVYESACLTTRREIVVLELRNGQAQRLIGRLLTPTNQAPTHRQHTDGGERCRSRSRVDRGPSSSGDPPLLASPVAS